MVCRERAGDSGMQEGAGGAGEEEKAIRSIGLLTGTANILYKLLGCAVLRKHTAAKCSSL